MPLPHMTWPSGQIHMRDPPVQRARGADSSVNLATWPSLGKSDFRSEGPKNFPKALSHSFFRADRKYGLEFIK